MTDFFSYLAVSPTETISVSTLFLVVTAAEIIISIVYSLLLMRQVKPQALGTEMETPSLPTPVHV